MIASVAKCTVNDNANFAGFTHTDTPSNMRTSYCPQSTVIANSAIEAMVSCVKIVGRSDAIVVFINVLKVLYLPFRSGQHGAD